MNAQRKIIPFHTTDPAASYRAERMEPHHHKLTSTYCHHFDHRVPDEVLRLATFARKYGEPFSMEAAAISYMMDIDRRGKAKSKADYRRLWGWSEQQQRTRWDAVLTLVNEWKTMHGRKGNSPKSANGQPTDEQRNGNGKDDDSSAESQGSNGQPTDEQRNGNGHTKPTSNSQQETTTTAAPLSGDVPEWLPSWEELQAFIALTYIRIPEPYAALWYREVLGGGGYDSKGNEIRNWRRHLRSCWKDNHGRWKELVAADERHRQQQENAARITAVQTAPEGPTEAELLAAQRKADRRAAQNPQRHEEVG